MKNATSERTESWKYLSDLDPDLALLQEVNSMPDFIRNDFSWLYQKATNKDTLPQKFGTAVLIKGKIVNQIQLLSESNWVNEMLNLYGGIFVAAEVIFDNGFQANVVSVHSPAWFFDSAKLDEIEKSKIKLKNNRDIWGTELLWSALSNLVSKSDLPWIVGGDFNASTTFDLPKNRGNQEVLDRMTELNLTESLFHSNGHLIPTFKNPSNRKILHQIDHLFIAKELFSSLQFCAVGNSQKVFNNNLSDHLPIIADFSI